MKPGKGFSMEELHCVCIDALIQKVSFALTTHTNWHLRRPRIFFLISVLQINYVTQDVPVRLAFINTFLTYKIFSLNGYDFC